MSTDGVSAEDVDVIVFDVNETLSDMRPLGAAFAAVGTPEQLAATWFAGILRDGFAAAVAGDNVPFARIAERGLIGLLATHGVDGPEQAVTSIMNALQALEVHPDVVPGIEALHGRADLVTLGNGSAATARGLLEGAGVVNAFARFLSVEDAPAWKPHRTAYAHAASTCDSPPERMLMVAVHPWDIHGAHAAGLRTAWIDRDGGRYPEYFTPPDLAVPDLVASPNGSATTCESWFVGLLARRPGQ
ncbi:haloacid dehalogenase, type II [Tersicoccus phoenicis]|uniref:Haloacid dehalogenase, type II n=1 Tax=Tersicoccus phoenicis TaxID=554083 RepID=A0A1R1LBR5_9MICC|nr:haloacid dehalogenase type II [Tersicoccus phoenicis]OMH24977.1 haloacid dehalogenase, type II [Tersicoccus phoenicis]